MKKTAVQVAEKYGVSEKTVRRDGIFARVIDQIVVEYGDPEVKRKLLGTDVKLTHGTARVLLKMPARERKKALEELLEKGDLSRAKKDDQPRSKPRELAHSLVERLQKRSEAHARSVVQQMARLVGLKVVEEEGEK